MMRVLTFVIFLSSLSLLVSCSNSTPDATSGIDQTSYNFTLGKKFFTPTPGVNKDFTNNVEALSAERLKSGGDNSSAHVILQFKKKLTAELSADLNKQGIIITDRINPYTWVAEVNSGSANAIVKNTHIRWATQYPVAAKTSSSINLSKPFEWQKRDNNKQAFSVLFHKGVSAKEARHLVKSVDDFSLESFDDKSFPIVRSAILVLSPDQLGRLTKADIVQWVEPSSPEVEDHNFNNAQPLSNANTVQIAPYNLNGTGVTVGVWEAGDVIDTTPLDLAGRVIVQTGQTAGSDDHAVHVAGTIGASGTNVLAAEGMAPAVTIASWDATSDAAEMANAANSTGLAGQPTPIQLSNHSYGIGRGWNGAANVFTADQNIFGQYTINSLAFDNVVAQTGLIIFNIAGNQRDDVPAIPVPGQPGDCLQGGLGVAADCINDRATAKNVITLGAMNGAAAIAGFSSYGPTDDGRIKPDLVAQGVGMTSLACNCFDDRDGNGVDDIVDSTTATRVMGGTSMSTPVATGVAALLLQEANNQGVTMTPEGMKALLIQTAQDVNGPGQSNAGPDYATGWGIVDAQAAADLLRLPAGEGLAQETLTATGLAGGYTHSFFVPAGQGELHVTLAWTDPVGNPAAPSAAQLVNDLDLRLIAPNDTVTTPWGLTPAAPGNAATRNAGDDSINNVEQVSILNPASGVWTVRVTAKAGSLIAGSQNFAIAGPLTPATGPIASTKSDIMLVMDRSGSMILPSSTTGLNKLQALQSAASELVDYIEIVGGHQLGLVQFDTTVTPLLPIFDLQALDAGSAVTARNAITGMSLGNMTNIIDGATQAQAQLSSPASINTDKAVILFSDGKHNRPVGTNVADIDTIITSTTDFHGIGFGTDVDSSVMSAVATNHDGLYFEEQSLSAGQLSKLFLTVAGLTVNEDIVIDPDYAVASGASATQNVGITKADHAVTFATHWDTANSNQMIFTLQGPDGKCRIPIKDHDGLKTRAGKHYRLIRVELPYACVTEKISLHEGVWRLVVKNIGDNADTAKITVLADSSLKLVTDVKTKNDVVFITASLQHERKRLAEKISMKAALSLTVKSTGDSEKQDKTGRKFRPELRSDILSSGLSPQLKATLSNNAEMLKISPSVITTLPQASLTTVKGLSGKVLEAAPATLSGIQFRDDGKDGDRIMGDGIYTARVKLTNKGLYQSRISAGIQLNNQFIMREKLISFYNH